MRLSSDKIILELLPEFVSDWLNDIETEFIEILVQQDQSRLYRFGHTLNGSCLQFGLKEPAQLGVLLMKYAETQDWAVAREMKEPLRASFINIKKMLQTQGLKQTMFLNESF
jgi:HPt (histidine-containing phosphotransfer) domain-containing protein